MNTKKEEEKENQPQIWLTESPDCRAFGGPVADIAWPVRDHVQPPENGSTAEEGHRSD